MDNELLAGVMSDLAHALGVDTKRIHRIEIRPAERELLLAASTAKPGEREIRRVKW